MALALGSVWEETKQALVGMADPVAVQANIVSAMAMYMMLWVIPEPVSKGLAALLTASLMAYLGVDMVWSLMVGWRRLVEESDRATSFLQLREAGERYGKVLGKNAARVFVMLAAAAIGSTAGLATKGPGLPGFSQATALAETQGGFRLAALAEVEAVAVSAEGAFSIALAPGAVAMSAQGQGATASPRPGRQSSSNPSESIRALKARLAEHRQKLEAYNVNPDAFDNKGLLKSAPSPEIRQRIIEGRIKHLEDEIRAFEKGVKDLEGQS